MSGPPNVGQSKPVVKAVSIPLAPAAANSLPSERRTPGVEYHVATSLDAVLAAWSLVHDCHAEQGWIRENAFGVHTTLQAASPGATVLCAKAEGELASTLTIARDGARGLALDASFGAELNRLRNAGQRLSEICLMASRGPVNGLERLLSISLDYALRDDYSAVAMAVHPRHASYFSRVYGFEARGSEHILFAGKRQPARLIVVDREAFRETAEPPPGVRALRANPVPSGFYTGAFGFLPSQVLGTRLAAYLAECTVPEGASVRRTPLQRRIVFR